MARDYDDLRDRVWLDDAERGDRSRSMLARRAVSMPAKCLILFGLFGFIVDGGFALVAFSDPEFVIRSINDYIAKQPPGRQKDDLAKQMKTLGPQLHLDTFENAICPFFGIVMGPIMILGGIMMKNLSSYGWAMTAAIVGIIPLGGCCCFATPFGIWALIVLLRPEVKDAFDANRT